LTLVESSLSYVYDILLGIVWPSSVILLYIFSAGCQMVLLAHQHLQLMIKVS